MPVPSWVRPAGALDPVEALEDVWHFSGWNAHARVPHRQQLPSPASRCTSISPVNVNLKALVRRLKTIFSTSHDQYRRLGAVPSGQSTINRKPAFSLPSGNYWRVRSVRRPGRSARKTAWMRPASMREKSRSVLTSFSSRRALRWTASRSLPLPQREERRAPSASASSSGPSISVSGVRNSWLTLRRIGS